MGLFVIPARVAHSKRVSEKLLVEIVLCRGFNSVDKAAHGNGVEIKLQYLILTVGFLQLYCKIRFSDFALVGLLGGKQLIFYELLGYCGAALHGIAGGVKNERTYKALEVDAYMTVKANILNGDDGVFKVIGDIVKLCPFAVFGAVIVCENLAVYIVDNGGKRCFGED